jgi:hypothetical protein
MGIFTKENTPIMGIVTNVVGMGIKILWCEIEVVSST